MLSTMTKFAAFSALALCVGAQQCAIGGDASIVALTGDSVGTEQVVNGSECCGKSCDHKEP